MPIALLALMLASAQAAAGALVFAPAGDPLPGSTVTLELVTWAGEDAVAYTEVVPRVEARQGQVLGVAATERPGVWAVRWRAPEQGEEAELLLRLGTAAPAKLSIPLGTRAVSGLTTEAVITGRASGSGPLSIAISGEALPDTARLAVVSTEGEVLAVEPSEEGLVVRWQPADVREARVVPLGLLDRSRPDTPPVWVSARLKARVPVSVSTDPGTELLVKVSGRTYGPVKADADGRATTVVDLWPGEQRGEATLSDDLGNVQRTPIVLPGSGEPVLLAVAGGELIPGATPPPVYLRAVDPRGKAWSGATPECRGTGVGVLQVHSTGAGTWEADLPQAIDDLVQDLRVDCALPGTAARWTLRIPAGRGTPQRVVLRVYPEELTGDFPVAQVQAHVEDLAGDRLPPTHLSLAADHGELTPQPSEGLRVAADYAAAIDVAEDRIVASWVQPASAGVVWNLEVAQDALGGLLIRAVDLRGSPLVDVPVSVGIQDQVLGGESNQRGWLLLPWSPTSLPAVIEARSGGVVRRAVYTPWSPLPVRDPVAPDLVASSVVTVQAGRVREVYIAADPGVLNTGTGDTARVTVRLLDRSGLPVWDEAVRVEVDRGEITGLKALPDGSMEATYVPPQGLTTGRVEVRAQGEDGSFAATTSLELRPRPVRHSLSVVTGVLAGPGPRVSPLVALDYETHFPLVERGLYLRVSGAGWLARTTVPDSERGVDVELRMEMLSLSASVMGRWERDLWTAWAGGGPHIVPYRLEIRYPGVTSVSGLGLHQPGVVAFAGGGRRFRAGEVFVELRGLGVTAFTEDFGFEGQLGGVAASAGFRLIF